MRDAPIEFTAIGAVKGPIVMARGTHDIGWDEAALIRLGSGELRHGVVLEVSDDVAVVQIYEGTAGVRPSDTTLSFAGSPMSIHVGEAWLGRVWNGRGEPIDGGPPVLTGAEREIAGFPLNPTARMTPAEPVLTGVAAIDVLTTLVRGQKLPVFSVGGLPHLELAAQIAAQATAGGDGEQFRVIFAAMGVTHADASMVRDALEARAAAGDLALFVNTADDPIVERLLTPRIALTVAEHLAFERGFHVLVVMADMTSYCEALREVASARGEAPARRGYPGYLYSDLASIYERCGRLRDRPGSITQIPVLTMPAGDITHPVPDLTGYITEGQIVLDAEIAARGVYPPIDALSSLSRMMRRGVGPGRTRADHIEVAAQLDASVAQARTIRDLAELVGPDALSPTDRHYLTFLDTYERRLVSQRPDEAVAIDEAFARAWSVLSVLPRRELTMIAVGHARRVVPAAGTTSPARRAIGVLMRVRHPTGRGGRLWLVDRLGLARRAADLLTQKERVLLREQRRLVVLHRRTRAEWEQTYRDAQTWIARATALQGRRVVALAGHTGYAAADLVWRNSMGAYYPAEASCSLPDPAGSADLTGTSAMAEAALAHRRALEAAVQHAATRRALAEVDRELTATRRRLRMLERHWTPALTDALHDLDAQLEEREREEHLHARWSRPEGIAQ